VADGAADGVQGSPRDLVDQALLQLARTIEQEQRVHFFKAMLLIKQRGTAALTTSEATKQQCFADS
jgi:hypothetical protein